jgi:CrcB protein
MPSVRRSLDAGQARLAAVIALGGATGAVARWAIGDAWPVRTGAFPWSTLAINVGGCLAIGVLMVLMEEVLAGRVYVRPLLGVGFLGGFTTFSTFAVETHNLLGEHPILALTYYLGTPAAAVLAAIVGAALTTAALKARASLATRRSSE